MIDGRGDGSRRTALRGAIPLAFAWKSRLRSILGDIPGKKKRPLEVKALQVGVLPIDRGGARLIRSFGTSAAEGWVGQKPTTPARCRTVPAGIFSNCRSTSITPATREAKPAFAVRRR